MILTSKTYDIFQYCSRTLVHTVLNQTTSFEDYVPSEQKSVFMSSYVSKYCLTLTDKTRKLASV